MNSEDNFLTLPDLNNTSTQPKKIETMLAKAISKNDTSYIQEFLISDTKKEDIEKLVATEKKKLALILTEFLDQPLRLQAIECIYDLIKDIGAVNGISQALLERSVDFKKLIVLKGKLDYLKYLKQKENSKNIENEYDE